MGVASTDTAAASARDATGTTIARGILHARIMHIRYAAKPYIFRHRLWYLALPISAAPKLDRAMIGYNKIRPFSLRQRDYGTGHEPLEAWVRRAFSEASADMPDGEIVLLTLPRIFGVGFNPVSFWLCHNRDGKLVAALAEVNNTFGERHCYVVRKPDGSTISGGDELHARKVFHVSPFLPVEGDYAFRFSESADELAIRIDLRRAGKRVLTAAINGRFAPLSNRTLLGCFIRYPLPAVQVLGFIHYHAARLYMRGLKYFPKPSPPEALVSGSRDTSKKPEGLKTHAL
jgi:uncharacterized protein